MFRMFLNRYTVALALFAVGLSVPAFAQNESAFAVAEAKADKAMEQGKIVPAIGMYTKLIAENPKRFKLYLSRGIAYYQIKQFDKAALDFTSFTKLRPALLEGYLNRAYAYKEMRKYRGALADLDIVEAIDSGRDAPRRLREEILMAMSME